MRGKVDFPVTVDTKLFHKAMKHISEDALPEAIAQTLNMTADTVTREQERNIRRLFIIRTPYTINSTMSRAAKPFKGLNKARGKNISKMFSRAGSFSPYLWMQDVDGGFIEKGMYGGPVPIPTLKTRVSGSKQKAIRKKYRISASEKFRPGDFGTVDGYARHFVGKPRGGSRPYGVYERGYRNRRLNMLRNLEHRKIKIRDTNFHDNAVNKYGRGISIAARYRKIAQRYIDKAVRRA